MVKGLYMDTIELLHFYRKPALTEVQEQQLSQFIARPGSNYGNIG